MTEPKKTLQGFTSRPDEAEEKWFRKQSTGPHPTEQQKEKELKEVKVELKEGRIKRIKRSEGS